MATWTSTIIPGYILLTLEFPSGEAIRGRLVITWRCEFCGAVNERKSRICNECNAVRNFLYN